MQQPTRQSTKNALIRSAERLFAEKGLGTVSVKEITRAAGARNPSAVHYHFGNVETLIKEVFLQRFKKIEEDRLVRLAQVTETEPKKRLVALLEAALTPYIQACLEEEGRLYVRFCVQLFTNSRFDPAEIVKEAGAESVNMLRAQVIECLDGLPENVLVRRLRQGLLISLLQADDYSRQVEDGTAPPLEEIIPEFAVSIAGYMSASIEV